MDIPEPLEKEIKEYCRANDIPNIDTFTLKLIRQGFTTEKFGSAPVIKTVEKIVEKIVEVPVEKIVEKIVEVPIAMIDSEISESHKNYMRLYEESIEKINKLSEQLMITEKQLVEEKHKPKKDLYGEQ